MGDSGIMVHFEAEDHDRPHRRGDARRRSRTEGIAQMDRPPEKKKVFRKPIALGRVQNQGSGDGAGLKHRLPADPDQNEAYRRLADDPREIGFDLFPIQATGLPQGLDGAFKGIEKSGGVLPSPLHAAFDHPLPGLPGPYAQDQHHQGGDDHGDPVRSHRGFHG